MSSLNYFQLENDLKQTVRMDAPLTKGPAPRWERLGMANASNSSLANVSGSVAGFNSSRSNIPKTPKDKSGKINKSASESKKMSSKKSKSGLTPGNDASKRTAFADRLIPVRTNSQFDVAHHNLMKSQPSAQENEGSDHEGEASEETTAHQRLLDDHLKVSDKERIFSYSVKPAAAPDDHINSLKVVYTQSSLPPSVHKAAGRFIATKPDRILDAPALVDDFYLHPIDWSKSNHVAVALSESVYVWNASTSEIFTLASLDAEESEDITATAVAWVAAGSHLAVGTSNGEVWLYDVAASRRVRRMRGHTSRVPCLSWNEYVISSGSGSGSIHHYDVRVPQFCVASLPEAHSGLEVCGLSWSPDKKYLASGGNDNTVKIWAAGETADGRSVDSDSEPVSIFTHHQAAVKALSWCPWRSYVLASGGGTNDRAIRIWNVDTQSQVSALAWSEEYHELVSAHGHSSNQIIIWKAPSLEKVARLEGHESRILDMALSPDSTTIVTAGADETLRIWKCFAVDEQRKKAKAKKDTQAKGGRSAFQQLMR
ncbi:unnamed protein product [Notodromas monacha]|uniref:CDC20/Fizzy WD40 domain-containing protein n=1 Tax=Notodromas monacha TaxID=399045 RepID=A0A7R9BD93_9CRUS|nr:unnamed protein product [Notodromas monacha]CAG0913183.1 unnamed protein product [Notodromas monacha]